MSQTTLVTNLHRTLDVADLAIRALRSQRGHLLESIFGPSRGWIAPYDTDCEFNILNPWQPVRALKYLMEVSVPAFSKAPGPWARTLLPPGLQRLFWRQSVCFNEPDPFGQPASHAQERLFFINGIGTNLDVARMNTAKLAKIHRRPITGIYNPTCSILLDLWECMDALVDKSEPEFNTQATMGDPDYVAAHAIFAALAEDGVKRVVLIAHSQGTIIAANVLKALVSLLRTLEVGSCEQHAGNDCAVGDGAVCLEALAYRRLIPAHVRHGQCAHQLEHLILALSKLEFHLYATCVREVRFYAVNVPSTGQRVRLPKAIWHYANEQDVIAHLGVLADPQGAPKIDGEQTVFPRSEHLLNAGYLG